jgi:hypothetical protein
VRWVTFERAIRFALGAALIIHEGIIRPTAQVEVLATGLGLLAAPDLIRFDRWMERLRQAATLSPSQRSQDQDQKTQEPRS